MAKWSSGLRSVSPQTVTVLLVLVALAFAGAFAALLGDRRE